MGRLDTDFFFLKMDWVGDAELKAYNEMMARLAEQDELRGR